LLYAINGGRDELTGEQVAPAFAPVAGDVLEYDDVLRRLDTMMDWLAQTYVDALNVIHYMHDKYCYERMEMALHDYPVAPTMACGIAGLSVAADSLGRDQVRAGAAGPRRQWTGGRLHPRRGLPQRTETTTTGADDLRGVLVRTFMTKVRASRPTATPSRPSRFSPSPPTSCTAGAPATHRTAGAPANPSRPARTR
jgi:formate C-acetyltransferase